MEQENKFQSLINFVVSFNNIAPYYELTWEVTGNRLYIDGNPSILGNIFSLLWSTTKNYCFYFTFRNNSSMIEAFRIEEI